MEQNGVLAEKNKFLAEELTKINQKLALANTQSAENPYV